jgi:hypothetical protein
MPGIGWENVGHWLENMPFWPAASFHAKAGIPDHVAGTSTTARSGII